MNNSHEESSIRLKRPRSSLACIRCRNKKVKCDFDQPTCGRCSLSKAACHYSNLPRRVDGQAFDELNSHVDGLKGKMRDMQNELIRLKNNLSSAVIACNNQSDHQEQQSKVAWKLAWTPTGLRIDTTISNAADLYRALLNCISQLRINHHELITGNLLNSQPSTKRRKKNNYLVEHQFSFLGTQTHQNDSPLFDYLEHYHTCFLSYQIVDKEDFRRKYNNVGLETGSEALLIHSVNAWMAKHASIYHSANSIRCSNPMTAGESDFKQARHLLKRHFDFSRPSTIHALLNLYMYQLNCEQSSLAYLYIGLAIRMAQDLKLHKKKTLPADPKGQEIQKRLWWSAYWLDLWAALESNRPTMVDDKDCDLDYPARLDYEDEATGDRIQFCVQSIELLKIRKDLAKDMPSSSIQSGGEALLTTLSRLESLLTLWLDGLPIEFRYHEGMIKTGTFQDEARFILNIQYHATWIMLHKFFLSTHQQRETPVSVLSLDICTRSANLITEMLSLYAKQQHWCHFFYVLDGVLASVSIHELNALSSEEVAVDAQRQLIETANILRRSPLTYMERVNAIIQRIDDFFNEHQFGCIPLFKKDENSDVSKRCNTMEEQTSSCQQQQQQQAIDVIQNQPFSLLRNQLTYPIFQQQQQQREFIKNTGRNIKGKKKREQDNKSIEHIPRIMLNDPKSSLSHFNISFYNKRETEVASTVFSNQPLPLSQGSTTPLDSDNLETIFLSPTNISTLGTEDLNYALSLDNPVDMLLLQTLFSLSEFSNE